MAVKFSDGRTYRYTYASAGQENVGRMKGLAQADQGLNTFNGATVSKRYERRES